MVYGKIRPFVNQFLSALSSHFEIVIFTASLNNYSDPLMDILDPNKLCSYRLSREHCTFLNGIFVKDLTRLGRPIQDVIIVDNSPNAYLFQPENALPIVSWFENTQDWVLLDYIPILQGLAVTNDVWDHLAKFITNGRVDV